MSDDADKPEAGTAPDARQRLRDGMRDVGRRSREELTRKGGLPDTAHGAFRKWARKIWELRGGGAYAMGFIVAFLYFELTDILFDDIPQLYAMNSIFSADLFGFVIEFIIDTLMNTLYAFIWPVFLLQWNGPIGIALVVAIFVLFPKFVQKPVENWLFEGEPPPPKEAKKQKAKAGDKADA